MGQVVKRYPTFELSLYTEDDEYHITYEGRDAYSDEFIGESVISLSTKNAMEDDSAVFSLVLAGDRYWDRILQANDAVVLKIDPNEGGEAPANPVLLVGMISEVRLEGDYGENSKMYRITGQSFAKAFINFEVGVIQEVGVVLTDLGWLPDDDSGANGAIMMSGKNASQLAEALIARFIDYMQYKYKDGGIDKFLTWELDSWVDAEYLTDPTPFINYEGSLKQFLDDIAAKPFNELYFDATADEKCQMTMRRTPFDEEDWKNLPTYHVTSKEVISESVAISDTEAYSIFNISVPNMIGLTSMDLGSKPQFFKPLMDKFGYKKLEVENRYLLTSMDSTGSDDDEDADTEADRENDEKGEEDKESETRQARTDSKKDDNAVAAKNFNDTYALVMGKLKAQSKEQVRTRKDAIATSITKIDRRITKNKAMLICDHYYENASLTKDDFSLITGITRTNGDKGNGVTKPSFSKVQKFLKDNAAKADGATSLKNMLLDEFQLSDAQANSLASTWEQDGVLTLAYYKELVSNTEETTALIDSNGEILTAFTQRLANWYCENPNFYQGDIVVKGSPDYRLGGRLIVQDEQNNEIWEYYIESVQHDYSYTKGYTTTLGVTRGLQNNGNERFTNLWDTYEDFVGGYLGEQTLEQLLEAQAKENEKYNQSSGGGSSGGASNAGGEYTAGAGTQLAVFPIDVINITQGEYGGFSHQGSIAYDFVGPTAAYPYKTPFDCECVYTSSAGIVTWQSQRPVKFVDGRVDYVTLMCIHDNNWASHPVGEKKAKGSALGATGVAGNVTGDHAHMEVALGKYAGMSQNSSGTWAMHNQIHMYDVFSIKDNITGASTNIVNGAGYNWRSIDWDDTEGKEKGSTSKKDAKGGIYSPNMHGALGDYSQIGSNRKLVANTYKDQSAPLNLDHVGIIEFLENPPAPDVLPSTPGSAVAMNAFNWGMKFEKTTSGRQSMYNWGSGHYGEYPFDDDIILLDNSALVWWCYHKAGVTLGGADDAFTALSILNDSRLTTVNNYGQKNDLVLADLRVGDIISFSADRNIIGLYAGAGNVLICKGKGNNDGRKDSGIVLTRMNQGEWWMQFNGLVKRYK